MGRAPRLTYVLDMPELTEELDTRVSGAAVRATQIGRCVRKLFLIARKSLYVPYCSLECQHQTRRLADVHGG